MTSKDSFHEVAFNIRFWTRNISSARILFWRGVHIMPNFIWCSSGGEFQVCRSTVNDQMFSIGVNQDIIETWQQCNIMGEGEVFCVACHEWSRIILLENGCSQALKMRKDNGPCHLRDIVLAGHLIASEYNTISNHNTEKQDQYGDE